MSQLTIEIDFQDNQSFRVEINSMAQFVEAFLSHHSQRKIALNELIPLQISV